MNSDNRKVLAIIPARGGSKRLPGKNILPFASKPLIAWTIEAALQSFVFDEVIVSTDDNEIAEVSASFGATVPFMRPEHLANDTSSSLDVIKHALLWYQEKGIDFTDVVLLQATSPLRTKDAIVDSWKLYIKSNVESVVSVCKLEHPIQWTYSLNKEGLMESLFTDNANRSQEYSDNYRLNGAIYISTANIILGENKIISDHKCIGYVMDEQSSIDIDNKSDFDLAEYFVSKLK